MMLLELRDLVVRVNSILEHINSNHKEVFSFFNGVELPFTTNFRVVFNGENVAIEGLESEDNSIYRAIVLLEEISMLEGKSLAEKIYKTLKNGILLCEKNFEMEMRDLTERINKIKENLRLNGGLE